MFTSIFSKVRQFTQKYVVVLQILFILFCVLWVSETAVAAAFTPGNIVVLRIGDGSVTLSSAAAPVFLDEYTTSGTFVQTIALPTAFSGDNSILTMAGSATSEGSLALSSDRNFLTLTGYDAAAGTTSVAGTTSAAVNRIVGLVSSSGIVNTSTRISDGYNSSNIRSAVTDDGTRFWTGGNGATTTGGTRYVTLGSTGTSTPISGTPNNARWVKIFKGQLYVTSASGSNIGVNSVGSGLPTTSGQTTTLLNGVSGIGSAYDFVIFDLDNTVVGVDTLYVADQSNGLRKFSFDGTIWTARGNLTGTLTGITAIRTSDGVDLYTTVGTGTGNAIYKVTDAALFNADITGSGAAITTGGGTRIATAATNTVFRGIAFTPGSPSQVSPTAVSLQSFTGESKTIPVLLITTLLFLLFGSTALILKQKRR